MGHARYDELSDLEEVLDEIRVLPGVSEPRPGIFYVGRIPFLHFHTKDGRRWADAKSGPSWGTEIEIAFGCNARERKAFLREIRTRHATMGQRKRSTARVRSLRGG